MSSYPRHVISAPGDASHASPPSRRPCAACPLTALSTQYADTSLSFLYALSCRRHPRVAFTTRPPTNSPNHASTSVFAIARFPDFACTGTCVLKHGEYHSRCAFRFHILDVEDRSADTVPHRSHTPCVDAKSDKVLLKHDTTVMSYCSIAL